MKEEKTAVKRLANIQVWLNACTSVLWLLSTTATVYMDRYVQAASCLILAVIHLCFAVASFKEGK